MSTISTNRVTGGRRATFGLMMAVGGGLAAILALAIWLLVRARGPARDVVMEAGAASGSIEPTMQQIETGVSAEDVRAQRANEQWASSLALSDSERERREAAARRVGAPEVKAAAARTAKDLPVENDLMADVDAAEAAQLVGASVSKVVKRPDGSVSVVTGVDGAAKEATPYMSLALRELIAAQAESNGKAGSAGTSSGGSAPPAESRMVVYDVPSESAGPSNDGDPTQQGDSAVSGARMPVNILPSYTIPIFCSFLNDFVASGSGADTQQKVVVNVEQDVWARNRLQLPRNAKLIGTTGGVRALDLVDVTFDTIQFPDLTQVKIRGQAYQPYTNEAPNDFMMRGVKGEYTEPSIPVQLAPIFAAALQGASKSNIDRLAAHGSQIGTVTGTTSGVVAVETTDRDRLYGALGSATDKVMDMMMEKLKRYQPRVRIHHGQPLIVLLDEYVDLSKRTLMDHPDPLKQQPRSMTSTPEPSGANKPSVGSSTESTATPEKIVSALKGASPEQLNQLVEMAKTWTPTAPPAK